MTATNGQSSSGKKTNPTRTWQTREVASVSDPKWHVCDDCLDPIVEGLDEEIAATTWDPMTGYYVFLDIGKLVRRYNLSHGLLWLELNVTYEAAQDLRNQVRACGT